MWFNIFSKNKSMTSADDVHGADPSARSAISNNSVSITETEQQKADAARAKLIKHQLDILPMIYAAEQFVVNQTKSAMPEWPTTLSM